MRIEDLDINYDEIIKVATEVLFDEMDYMDLIGAYLDMSHDELANNEIDYYAVYDSPVFQKWLNSYYRDLINKHIEFYRKKMKDGVLKVWRGMSVKPEHGIQWNRLGWFWSYKKEGAEGFFSSRYGEDQYLFLAEVSEKDIDWVWTLAKNIDPGWNHEAEVRVKEGSKLNLLQVWKNGEPLEEFPQIAVA